MSGCAGSERWENMAIRFHRRAVPASPLFTPCRLNYHEQPSLELSLAQIWDGIWLTFQNSVMEVLNSKVASSFGFCLDYARLLDLVKGWENLRELGKLSRTPSQNFNILLLHVFWACRVFLGLLLPQVASPCLSASSWYSGDAFSECPFPTRPWEGQDGAVVLAFPAPLRAEAWGHRRRHKLNLCISGTACSALHFWLSEHVECVPIGVHLGVRPMEG